MANSAPPGDSLLLDVGSWLELLDLCVADVSGFGAFFIGLLSDDCRKRGVAPPLHEDRGLLPMPIPFPEAELNVTPDCRSARRRRRFGERRVAMRWANRVCALFSYFEVGPSDPARHGREVGAHAITPAQLAAAEGLLVDLLGWSRLSPKHAIGEGSGRSSKVCDVLKRAAASGYGACCGDIDKMVRTALPVSADRIALPTVAGRVAPEDYLSEPHRSEFLDVRRREAIPPGFATGARACHHISGAEEVKLLARLCDANMGAFHLERDIMSERARASMIALIMT